VVLRGTQRGAGFPQIGGLDRGKTTLFIKPGRGEWEVGGRTTYWLLGPGICFLWGFFRGGPQFPEGYNPFFSFLRGVSGKCGVV